MKLISVNIGSKRTQPKGVEIETTGIYKLPSRESVQITSLGIREDFICDQKNHGGPDQAIYVYGASDYAWWSKELGREIEAGTFGENLTVSKLESAQYNIGDRLHAGSAILEVTAPRYPCSTLAARMGDSMFVKAYRRAGRPGLYCRVIREGTVQAGDEVKIEPFEGETSSIARLFSDYYDRDVTEEALRRHLHAPLAMRLRKRLKENLEKVLAQRRE